MVLLLLTGATTASGGKLNLVPGYRMEIEGTSNLRSWNADVTAIDVECVLSDLTSDPAADLQPDSFETVTVHVPVTGISSDIRGLTGRMHKYLKKEKHPVITFNLKRVLGIERLEDMVQISARGVIHAAGTDSEVDLQIALAKGEDGLTVLSASKQLTMSEFGIEPPTALFGTVRAADEFSVSFRMSFSHDDLVPE